MGISKNTKRCFKVLVNDKSNSLTLDANYRMDTTAKQVDSANLEQYLDQNEGFFELTPQPQSTATSPGDSLTATMAHLDVSEQPADQPSTHLPLGMDVAQQVDGVIQHQGTSAEADIVVQFVVDTPQITSEQTGAG